ncbi:nipped-B-like protein A isoform X2 [Rhopilema esculentum]|uniref:nipped-B-like protein A isoform X2 n=1 Tax=Rhopilema esculentum TaxID=499914 RepID=UPI0031E26710
MNNKPENVPIATLSALTSLSDVIGILPLPNGLPGEDRHSNSLISTQAILHDARQILNGEQIDHSLTQRLQAYLSKINTSYLDFKNLSQHKVADLNRDQVPVLLQQMLVTTPHIFTPNYEQYASPSKMVNIDLTTPRHSLLRPHGPQVILSPSRSGHHIPVAHVSPLRQDVPSPRQGLQKGNPVRSSSLLHECNDPQRSRKETGNQHNELAQRKQTEQTAAAGNTGFLLQSGLIQKNEEVRVQEVQASSIVRRRKSSGSKEHVRRQLYDHEESQIRTESEKPLKNSLESRTAEEINQQIGNEGLKNKESPVKDASISPGSLKVSINRSDLKESSKKSPEKVGAEEALQKREYPKRRRIDRLTYLETGQMIVRDEHQTETLSEPQARAANSLAQIGDASDEKGGWAEQMYDDVMQSDSNEREARPIIPKLVLKRVKRKQGSKEFDTLEIVSPTKAELGLYYGQQEESVESKSTAEESEVLGQEAVVSSSELRHEETRVQQEIKTGGLGDIPEIVQPSVSSPSIKLDRQVVPVLQRIDASIDRNIFQMIEKRKAEQVVTDNAEGRSLRRKRRRVSSESEEGEEMFTDTLQDYGGISKKKRTNRVLQLDQEIEIRADTKRLIQLLQEILSTEDELESDGALDFGDDGDIPLDALLPRPLITDFYIELSKIKSTSLTSELPHDQLVRIVSIMDRHVRASLEVLLNQPKDAEDEEEKLWKGLKMDRVLRACEASLIILHITTAPEMPKQVYMEEVIEHVVSFCRFQLENTIYPEYDPVYRVDPDSKFDSSIMLPKSRRARGVNSTKLKPILQLYNKLCELVSLIADLVALESLNDIIILKISCIGTAPFFVENISILQLEALKLVRTIFRTYVKHRDLILDDILASLARLPSSKRNLRNYRLYEDSSIQMVTALVLQLVQCTVSIPDSFDKKEDTLVDIDVMIVTSYEDSLRAAQNFLATFLKKCSSASKDENDFRPLFENFLQDILTTLNKPEWPAAEVLLTLLGKLLIVTFNNKSNEMSLRVAAMDYLALIASHLRRDAVESRGRDKEDLKEIIGQLHRDADIEDKDDISVDMIDVHINTLRKALLSYLAYSAEKDVSCKFAREFYLGQWIRDVHVEMEKCMKAPMMSIPGAASTEIPTDAGETSIENLQELDERKRYYHAMATDKSSDSLRLSQQKVTYQESCIITKYLTSSRSFCQSFDIYLQQIFKMLNEPAVALRTKAVRALTSIVTVDPNILGREDVQISVHCRFRDQSTLVREAAVDLIGHFVLKCPDITDKYYDMIIERILDTGISVRKRVIKILRDICIEQPDFPKIPEICIKMIRRVNDEEGIRDLVTKVFQKMWFTPVAGSSENNAELTKKSKNIMKVVAMCKDCGYEWFENLLDNLLDGDDESVKKTTEKSCQQLVASFIQRLIKMEQENGSELVACLTTLYLLCKIRPQLLVQHATTLQPYLRIKCSTQGDALIIQNVARILENVIPLVDHPNPKFLADLEEDLMKLIIKQGQNIVQSCISCLDAVVNQVTRNYKFVLDCFEKFHVFLEKSKKDLSDNKQSAKFAATRPALLRSLFIAGLLCKHFDFDRHMEEEKKGPVSLKVLETCLFFAKHSDQEVRLKAIMAVGFVCMTKPEYLLRNDCKSLYQQILSDQYQSARGKCMLLKSLQNHLMEEEARMTQSEGRKKKLKKQKVKEEDGNIKEFGDTQAGTTSAFMQVMLKSILDTFFNADAMVRLAAVQVIGLILRQGLIHPAQCVPYLIAAGTDDDKMIRAKAEQALADIHKRHAAFIHMKAVQGIKLSYQLQKLIQCTNGGYLQGFREGDPRSAFTSHVYSMVRPNKQYRRPLLQTMLKQFDDQKNEIDFLYYLAENLAYLPYVTQEEPLFVMHHCDMVVSVTGAGYLQNFKEVFFPARKGKGKGKSPSHAMEDEEDLEDAERLGGAEMDLKKLEEVVRDSFSCMLLLELKQHLKQLYGFADSKCQKYSPSEPSKLYDKTMTRRGDVHFNSHFKQLMFHKDALEKEEMINYYIEFKQLMLSLDAEEDSEELEPQEKPVESKPEAKNEEKAATDGVQMMTDERPATVMEANVTLQTAVEQKEAEEIVDAKSKDAVLFTEKLPDDTGSKQIEEDCASDGSSGSKTRRRSSRGRK